MLADFFEDSDGDGVLYSNDLSVLEAEGAFELMYNQGIKSFLHAQINEKDHVKLFLGFDDCTSTRVWSEKEVNSLVYTAKMLAIFLAREESEKIRLLEKSKDLDLSQEEVALIDKLKRKGAIQY